MTVTSVRIDKWLWAVRIFKTRSLAADACKGGKVEISEATVKASREVKIGEIIYVRIGQLNKKIKVIGLTENRVSAKLAVQFVEDLTPPEEYKKIEMIHKSNFITRDKGSGRPTKKDRREMDSLLSEW